MVNADLGPREGASENKPGPLCSSRIRREQPLLQKGPEQKGRHKGRRVEETHGRKKQNVTKAPSISRHQVFTASSESSMSQGQRPQVSASSCTPSVSVIILYPECQRHYPVPRVSLSCTPSVSVIILYPQCQCHYPVPQVSVSLSCTLSVSVIILYPQCQCHYPVPRVVSVIILYPQCQCHYPVPPVSVSLSCTPSVSVIILYPDAAGCNTENDSE
ncbi:unnamed protein product [Ranitomeya imitator]|uniref:Uncharacterized protein n=1 Tax=Ranitomeya imitator TaxID=111125 RepID=A0ABN9KZJ8_9NEOB|nr:unnamed protein product [Ranitomeya imitator]